MSDDFREILNGVEDETKALALDVLGKLGDWATSEAIAATTFDDIKIPVKPGGGQLDGMSLDEALSRADGLIESTAEQIRRKKERAKRAGEIAEAVATRAIRVLVGGLIAAI